MIGPRCSSLRFTTEGATTRVYIGVRPGEIDQDFFDRLAPTRRQVAAIAGNTTIRPNPSWGGYNDSNQYARSFDDESLD